MIGQVAIVTEKTKTGTMTTVGAVTQTATNEGKVTHVTVEGTIAHEMITGLPTPVEEREGEPRKIEMIPLEPTQPHLISVELQHWSDDTVNLIDKAKGH